MAILMTQPEISLLTGILKPEHTMLEWGCGGSTLHFNQFVKEYYSVEHNKEWFEKISKLAGQNVKMFHVPPEFPHSGFDPAKRGQFISYVNFPLTLGKKFDRILIDGRDRLNCA